MGAQSELLNLVGQAGVTASKIGEGLKPSKSVNIDGEMAKYARQMRDAKLQTAKSNAQLAKLKLENFKMKMGGN